MADDTADIPPAYSTGDDWWTAVHLLTGYQPPKRGLIFSKLLGNNKIPLMKLEISDWDVSPDLAELSAINAMSWRTQNSGWRIQNTDFIVPFFNGSTSVGSTVNMRKARITLLGTDSDHSVPAGGVDMGATFTENGSHLMPDGFEGWDSRPLSQYSYGGGMALESLLNPPYSTWRYAWNDIHVDDPAAVDLTGFDRVASAFDRAAQFFHLSRTTIQGWEDELGTEDASWQGQAAGVFWDIIHQLGITYQNYTDTLPLAGVFSKAGNDLRHAKQGVYNALSNLHATWSTWALYTGNPLRWLHDILLEVTDDIWDNNLVKVRAVPEYHGGYYGGSTTWSNKVSKDGFRVNALNRNGGNYGDLNDLNTWKSIGEEAVKRWQQSVVDQLGVAGSKALKDVHNAWAGINTSMQKLTTQSVSLQSDYQADKAAAEQKKADDAAAAAAAHEKEMEEKADKQRAEDLAHQKEMEDKADKQRAEDLAHQKEMEDKAEKERQEQEQHQKEQEEKAEKERQEQEQHQKEQEAKQEQLQKEQEQHQKEQEAKQEQQYQQQQQEQKDQQAKQEQLQKEQEAKAEQQYQQQMAMQTAVQQQQEKKQEEQEKKQEQLQQKQEDEAKQQYEQQRQDQQEQEKKQEEQQKHQEELAQQQYAQQQKTQADYQQKQEDQAKQQYEQQRKDQQEQEAKAEQLQKQQQDQAEKQYEQQKQDQQQYQLPGGGNGQQQMEQQLQQQQDQFQHQLENGFNNGQIGSQTHVNPDGTVTTDFSDGSSTTIDPHTGMETTTLPDGSVSTEHLSHDHALTNPDGSTTTVNDDGTLTTHYPDGSVTTVNPRTGMATTHEPDGQTITTPLGGGATLPHVSSPGAGSLYEPELHDLPFNGSLGSAAPMATEAVVPGSAVSQSGGVLPLGTRIDGTTTGGTPAAGSPMMGGGGMGGMPMGGMGGMGGGEKNGSGERVRQVYDDEDIVTSGGGSLGRRSRRGTSYEEETAAGRRTPTAAGYDPYGAGDERERTQSGDRERETWVPEEEDVWGTDEGGAPAVIG
jgi:hypothetical protein